MNFSELQVTPELFTILDLIPNINDISFDFTKGWNNVPIPRDYNSIRLSNLQNIYLYNCRDNEHEINRFIRLLSANESVKQNLIKIMIDMLEMYDTNLLECCLKAKSYGFRK